LNDNTILHLSFATGQRQWGTSNCNCNGTGAGATGAGALGYWGNSDSDCNGNGDRISIVLQRRRGNGDGGVQSIAMGQWGNSNRTVLKWQWGVGGDVYVVLQRKTSTIVVVKNVQNVWMTNIRDVLCCD
jgi:hypothetical protein